MVTSADFGMALQITDKLTFNFLSWKNVDNVSGWSCISISYLLEE